MKISLNSWKCYTRKCSLMQKEKHQRMEKQEKCETHRVQKGSSRRKSNFIRQQLWMGLTVPVKGRGTCQCDVGKGKGTRHLQEIMFGLEKEANWNKKRRPIQQKVKAVAFILNKKRFNKNSSTDKDVYYTMIKRLRRKIQQ